MDSTHSTSQRRFLAELVRAYERLGARGSGVLLAVSGGADSMALLVGTALIREGLSLARVEVASLDHGLRSESREEVDLVQRAAERYGLPFHRSELNVGKGPGVEARARELRYGALERIRAEAGLDWVATAHTATDQAETVLMRLCRGASTRGAAGTLARRGTILRPMLGVRREDALAFVREVGGAWVTDPMNADKSLLRPRIRHDVLPALIGAVGPHAVDRLAKFAEEAGEDADLLEGLAAEAARSLTLAESTFDAAGLRGLPRPLLRRVLARWFSEAGLPVDRALLERAQRALASGGRATLGRGLRLETAGRAARLLRAPGIEGGGSTPPAVLGAEWVDHEPSGLAFRLSAERGEAELAIGVRAEAQSPFTVRTRQAGDRALVGPQATRKLQDVLVDLKVPRELRDQVPLVVDAQGRIVWAAGVWPSRPPRSGANRFLLAQPIRGGQAPAWLVRYRLLSGK